MKTSINNFKMSILNSRFLQLVYISLWVSLFISGCSQPKYISSKWNSEEYKQVENIPVFDYKYDRDNKLFYMVSNDRNNLYIHLETNEETVQTKLLMFGFTVWIDTTARNKKQMGIRYPLARSDRKQIMATGHNRSSDVKGNFHENKNKIINQVNEIELIGFEGPRSILHLSATNDRDIRGNIKFSENGDMLYKLTIPMERIGVNTIKNKNILSLNMESGNPEISKPTGLKGRPAGRGMGGGRPGGVMGGNPQAMQKGKQELSQPVKIKLIIKLSENEDIR